MHDLEREVRALHLGEAGGSGSLSGRDRVRLQVAAASLRDRIEALDAAAQQSGDPQERAHIERTRAALAARLDALALEPATATTTATTTATHGATRSVARAARDKAQRMVGGGRSVLARRDRAQRQGGAASQGTSSPTRVASSPSLESSRSYRSPSTRSSWRGVTADDTLVRARRVGGTVTPSAFPSTLLSTGGARPGSAGAFDDGAGDGRLAGSPAAFPRTLLQLSGGMSGSGSRRILTHRANDLSLLSASDAQ